ncbi:MAG: hypothetical protein ACNA70_00760 [Brevefilum sp.]
MSVLICPECGAENPHDAEQCWSCTAALAGIKPVGSDQDDTTLLPPAEDDLTDLLHSLREDEDLSKFSAETGDGLSSSPGMDEPAEGQDNEDDEPEVPEWLNRIRQRAQTEPDSVGEITQKISAAKESLESEKSEDQRLQFEGLLQKIHGEGGEELPEADLTAESVPEDSKDPGTARSDWLKRIRKKHRPEEPETSEELLSEREGDSLLQWLVALEDGDEVSEEDEEEQPAEVVIPEETQEVAPLSATEEDTREISLEKEKISLRADMVLSVSREDQARAEQLTATILDEHTPRPVNLPKESLFPNGLRLAVAIALITILSLTLFLGTPGTLPATAPNPHSMAVLAWAQELPEGSSILVVLDYPAAFAAEMEVIAPPILRAVFAGGGEVSILASAPAGRLLFERMLINADIRDAKVGEDLGYYPVASFGAYGLANQLYQYQSQAEISIRMPAGPYDGVVILGDDYEGALAWIEQFSSLTPEMPIIVLVSAQAGPMLQPYLASGQVTGMISGLSEAVDLVEQNPANANRWRAYQVGTVLMILMLLIGMSFPAQPAQGAERQDA